MIYTKGVVYMEEDLLLNRNAEFVFVVKFYIQI